MPQNIQTEMLLVTSDDYWGHAGDFDATVNFYPYSFIITQSQYAAMDDSDKSRFFPCALFYYAGETDNHGFQPRRMGCRVEDDDSVSFARVQGVDRLGNSSIRDYRTGEGTPYSIPGSFSMLQGEGDSYETISAAAEAGSLPTGAFTVTDLLYNQEAVINTINQTAGVETETASAESYAAEEATPSGYDSADPTAYVAAPEASPTGYVDMDNHAEDYFASEGYHTRGDFTQDSAAGSGHGVPEYYGTNSAGPMVFGAEVIYGTDGSVVGQAVGNWDSTPFGFQAETVHSGLYECGSCGHWNRNPVTGDFDTTCKKCGSQGSWKFVRAAEGPEVMWDEDEWVSVRDGTVSDVIADEYLDMGEDYDDADDYARRAAKKMSAGSFAAETEVLGNCKDCGTDIFDDGEDELWCDECSYRLCHGCNRRCEGCSRRVCDEHRCSDECCDGAYCEECHKEEEYLKAEGLGDYTGPLTNGYGENSAGVSNYGVPVWYGSAETAYNGMGENSASISGQGVPQWYGSAEELPAGVGTDGPDNGFYPNSYGEDSSTSSQGVPQWYGSAENIPVQIQKSETRWAMAVGAAVLGALTAWTLSKKAGEESPEEPEEPEE